MQRPTGGKVARPDEQREIVIAFGRRMREARDLCRMTLSEAADRLGYQNPSKLSKIENANDTNSIPAWVLVWAAHVYDVSTDFLLGLTDDWEPDPIARNQRQIALWLVRQNEAFTARQLEEMRFISHRLHTAESATDAALSAIDALLLAMLRYMELNPKFDYTPGSATVVATLNNADAAARRAKAETARIRIQLQARGTKQ